MSTRTEAGNPGLRTIDHRLLDLAEHLDWNLAERIRVLVAADSMAHRVDDLANRAERAEVLAQECQRQLRGADRQIARLRDDAAARERFQAGR